MSDAPEFSVKPLADAPKPRKKPARKAAPKSNTQEINRTINSIFQDDHGHLPNMKKIQIKKHHPIANFFIGLIFIGALVAAGAWAKFIYWPTDRFAESNLEFGVTGPDTLTLGATSTYTVTIYNRQPAALKNVTVNIRYPAGFVFGDSTIAPSNAGKSEWTLGEILANKKKVFSISGRAYGSPADAQSWRALMDYQPANVNSKYQKTSVLNIKFDASPINIIATGPDKISAGADADYSFKIENKSDWKPAKLELELVLPAGFTVVSSTPTLNKNRWVLNLANPSSTPLSDVILRMRGKFANATEENTAVKAILYLPVPELDQNIAIAESNLATVLSKNAIAFTTAINGSMKDFSAQPGDTLTVSLNIKNTGTDILNKASIELTMAGPYADKQTLLDWKNIKDGADGDIVGKTLSDTARQGQITWNSAHVPALVKIKPNDEIDISFSLPIRDADQVTLSDFKENKITVTGNLIYLDANNAEQSLPTNVINITINSDLSFEARKTATIVNDKDQYDIKWILNNSFHPLKNISVSAKLLGDISWLGGQAPAGELKYNESTNEVSWTIPEMPDSVDVLALPFSIALNKKNPTANPMVGEAHITAEDTVTGQTISLLGNAMKLLE
ncbi:MAG: hypothetical protein WCT40_01030 [Candidatus Magasanikbacteria bacterium]|jgi:hypothetical protein